MLAYNEHTRINCQAKDVYKQAKLGPEDVQVVELHDCFSCNELLTYEVCSVARIAPASKTTLNTGTSCVRTRRELSGVTVRCAQRPVLTCVRVHNSERSTVVPRGITKGARAVQRR